MKTTGEKANDRQVGGEHYNKTGEQHWDRQYRLYGAGYFIGCATKYIERYKDKNGKQDLLKAVHFIEKLIELEYPAKVEEPKQFVNPLVQRGVLWDEPTQRYVEQD